MPLTPQRRDSPTAVGGALADNKTPVTIEQQKENGWYL